MNKIFLIVCIAVYFGVFYLTPLQVVADLVKFCFLVLALICFIIYSKGIHKELLKWSLLCTGFFLTSMVVSSLVLKQTITDSIIANLLLILPLGNAVFYFWNYRKTEHFFVELERAFLFVFWINLIAVIYVTIFNKTIVYYSTYTHNEIIVEPQGFPKTLLEFGTFYFFMKGMNEKKSRYFWYSLLAFATYHLADIQRVAFVSALIVCMLILFKFTKVSTRFRVGFFAMVIVLAFALLVNQVAALSAFQERFQQLTGFFSKRTKAIDDVSVLARTYEVDYAWKGFLAHPLFGNGMTRGSVKTEIIPGINFYVSDVGIIGILYAFGIVGMLFFLYQLKTTYSYYKRVRQIQNSFCQGVVFYLIYTAFNSVTMASYVMNLSLYIFCITIIILYDVIHIRAQGYTVSYINEPSVLKDNY
jgi:hypothetical protein